MFRFRDVHGNVAFTLPTAVPSGLNGLRPPAPEFVGRGPVLKARGWFPGGALAINLHGYEPDQRLDAGTALDRLLRRLGVPGEHVPTEVEERAELYRAVLHAYRAEGRAGRPGGPAGVF